MNIFEPLTTHVPSRSSAVVRVAPASEPGIGLGQAERGEPAPGGEVGQPALPSARRVPNRKIGIVPSDVCAATVIATDESIRVSSSIAIA